MLDDIDKRDLRNYTTIELMRLVEKLKKERDEAQIACQNMVSDNLKRCDSLLSRIKSFEEKEDGQLIQKTELENEISNLKLEQNRANGSLRRLEKETKKFKVELNATIADVKAAEAEVERLRGVLVRIKTGEESDPVNAARAALSGRSKK